MFGAFKSTAPLSGGLLWKIPWRLSPPQKLRQRRRLRRVDNVVSVLDNALKRSTASQSIPQKGSSSQSAAASTTPHSNASSEDVSTTADGQRLLRGQKSELEQRRHGRGPREGEFVPEYTEHGVKVPSGGVGKAEGKLLREQAAESRTIKLIERWKTEMPTEAEMLPRDKYSMFDKKVRGYRKGVHKLPKWTRVSQRLNPPGF